EEVIDCGVAEEGALAAEDRRQEARVGGVVRPPVAVADLRPRAGVGDYIEVVEEAGGTRGDRNRLDVRTQPDRVEEVSHEAPLRDSNRRHPDGDVRPALAGAAHQ